MNPQARWQQLNPEHTQDLYCEAITEDNSVNCPNTVEWQFQFLEPPYRVADIKVEYLFYCEKHKEERFKDPKWWSLRRPAVPTIYSQSRDYLAKALRSVQPGCHTCTLLKKSMMKILNSPLYTGAYQYDLACKKAQRLLEHRANKIEGRAA